MTYQEFKKVVASRKADHNAHVSVYKNLEREEYSDMQVWEDEAIAALAHDE